VQRKHDKVYQWKALRMISRESLPIFARTAFTGDLEEAARGFFPAEVRSERVGRRRVRGVTSQHTMVHLPFSPPFGLDCCVHICRCPQSPRLLLSRPHPGQLRRCVSLAQHQQRNTSASSLMHARTLLSVAMAVLQRMPIRHVRVCLQAAPDPKGPGDAAGPTANGSAAAAPPSTATAASLPDGAADAAAAAAGQTGPDAAPAGDEPASNGVAEALPGDAQEARGGEAGDASPSRKKARRDGAPGLEVQPMEVDAAKTAVEGVS
jgi:hypothetical protein